MIADSARALFTPRFRENERRKRGEDEKKEQEKRMRERRRATRLLLCKLRRRVKVCLQSARADRTALEMDKDLEDRSRSPAGLVRNLSADHVGPAFSRIVSRRESRDPEDESRSAPDFFKSLHIV